MKPSALSVLIHPTDMEYRLRDQPGIHTTPPGAMTTAELRIFAHAHSGQKIPCIHP